MFPAKRIDLPNLIYEYERRRIRYLADPSRYTLLVLIIGLVLAFATGNFLNRVINASMQSAEMIFRILFIMGHYMWVLDGVFGFHYALVAVRCIQQEMEAGRWDVLRLTAINEATLLNAKDVIAQTRAWRVMVWHSAIRMILAVCMVAPLALIPLTVLNQYFANVVMAFGVALLLAILTPYWLMRSMILVGLNAGLALDRVLSIISVVFGAAFIPLLTSTITLPNYFPRASPTWTLDPEFFYGTVTDILLKYGLSVILVFVVYRFLQVVLLRRAHVAAEWAFRPAA
jgi:hypothetical protein